MSKEAERLAHLTARYLVGLLVAMSGQNPDKETFLQIQVIHKEAQSYLEKLNIPIKIPLPATQDDIMTFLSGFEDLSLQVGREIGSRHSPRAEAIFFFTTSVIAYVIGRGELRLPDSPMFLFLRRDIRQEASELGFEAAPIEKFIKKPSTKAADALFEQLLSEQKPTRTRSRWIRLVIGFIALLCLAAGGLVWVLNAERVISGDWSTILPIVFIVLAVAFALFTWLIPFSPVDTKESVENKEGQVQSEGSPRQLPVGLLGAPPPVGLPMTEKIDFNGFGTKVQPVSLRTGSYKFIGSHDGVGQFAVWVRNKRNTPYQKDAVIFTSNKVKDEEGAIYIKDDNSYIFKIVADGEWKLSIQKIF